MSTSLLDMGAGSTFLFLPMTNPPTSDKAHSDTESVDEIEVRFRERIFNLCEPKNTPPLYHYTDAQGLIGIVENKEMWASHYRYLNDSSELHHGQKIFEEEVAKLIESKGHQEAEEFLRAMESLPNHFDQGSECYIFCFTEKPDLLNQWRDYGVAGGFSLGFEGQTLRRLLNSDLNGRLFKVHYDEPELRVIYRDMVLEFMLAWMNQLPSFSGRKKAFMDHYTNIISRMVSWTSMFFKHPAFKIEAEWRYCILAGDAWDGPPGANLEHFRSGRFGLTPYIKWPILEKTNKRIPFQDLYIGPTVDLQNAHHAVKLLLKRHGYSSIPVFLSTLPVRCR